MKRLYFLPLFDRPKINIVFSNTLKARSCIANQVHNSKNYSLEKMKQNTCFEMPLLLQIFDITFYLLMISTKTNSTYTTNSSQFFLLVLPHVCQSYQPEKLRNPVQKTLFSHISTLQKYIPKLVLIVLLYLP